MLFADAGRELLRRVDASLLVFGKQMLHVESGNRIELPPDAGAPNAVAIEAESLAGAARGLLGGEDEHAILLLLPPAEFVATESELPGVSGENLHSALRLQMENVLPALDQELELAVHESEPGAQIALWMKSSRINALQAAFAAKDLFLAAVKPRILHSPAARSGLVDADGAGPTFAQSTAAGVLRQWKHVDAADLEDGQFAEQWDSELRAASAGKSQRVESLEQYAANLDRQAHADYCFFPQAAVARCRREERRRHLLRASAALGVVAALACAPFAWQQVRIMELSAQLESRRELSTLARADRDVVVDFENRWGAVTDFPEQDVREAMYTLQRVLRPNRLSDLEVSEGEIRIQGTSEDPQSILQQLEQDPAFAEVVFSRATNNDQYHIDLRLAETNFEAYMARYFPDR